MTGPRGSRGGAWWWAAAVWASGLPLATRAQETSELITTALPFPNYYYVNDDHYGHRIGQVKMHYGASLAATFTDNRNLTSENRESDFGLTSTVNLGGFYRFSDRQKLQIDLGIGYTWWLESEARDGLYIAPSSHIDYHFGLGAVDISLDNITSTSANASDRPEYAGGLGGNQQDLAFLELRNTSNVGASWALNRSVAMGGRYSYMLTRSLTDQFTALNSDRHQFSLGPNWQVTAPISVGLNGSYTIIRYSENVQNDGETVSAGASVGWRARDNLSMSLSAGYAQSFYEQTGTIQDDSDFGGPTFSLSITHQINKRMRHTLAASRGMDTGFGSNYTDNLSLTYLLSTVLGRLAPVLSVGYTSFDQSGDSGESGGLYRVSLSNGLQLTRRLNLGASYTANIRSTGDSDRDYLENQVTATLVFSF